VNAPSAARTQRIRRARARDLAGLATLEAAAFEHPWTEAQLAAQLSASQSAIWLFEEVPDGSMLPESTLSYVLFLLLPEETELLRVATRPDARGRGFATRLLKRALRVLERTGRRRAHLEVASSNVGALSLYERLGFSASGRRRRYYADGADAVTMSRGPTRNG
jgi:ribosomal-protein-alanine N-acetyltransferase